MEGTKMTDYPAALAAAKRKLRALRDYKKAADTMTFETFYAETATTLKIKYGVKVSPGWVREQCLEDTDPSFLRVGALIDFLDEYQHVSRDSTPAEQEEKTDEDEELTYFNALKRTQITGRGTRVR
jgi:hypothetical protein